MGRVCSLWLLWHLSHKSLFWYLWYLWHVCDTYVAYKTYFWHENFTCVMHDTCVNIMTCMTFMTYLSQSHMWCVWPLWDVKYPDYKQKYKERMFSFRESASCFHGMMKLGEYVNTEPIPEENTELYSRER